MSFPNDIKSCMKDCILSILWPRKEIYKFFKDHDCMTSDLRCIDKFDEREFSRFVMVDAMFETLSNRSDNGLGSFRAMLQTLCQWDRFDPYYFEKLKQLDRNTADKNLTHLKQLIEIRDSKIREDRKRREEQEAKAQIPQHNLPQLRTEFLELHKGSLNPQARGYALEKILAELARIDSLEVNDPFKVNGEQIDGTIKYDGEHYLLEAKWQDKSSANESVYQFAGKIEGKMYGRGLFISVNGFSEYVIRSIIQGKSIKTIFIDGEDLVLVLEEQISFRNMIDKKVKAAQTKGLIYVNPITGIQKKGVS
jgi:Restriction endonuclease